MRCDDGKVKYANLDDASADRARIARKFNLTTKHRPYICEFCSSWHLTHLTVDEYTRQSGGFGTNAIKSFMASERSRGRR